MSFEDHFSGHAPEYAKQRPTYPGELFTYLADQSPSTECAWDCATGSGQAAVALAEFYNAVIATDASAEQVKNASPHPKVTYRVAPAEKSGIPSASCDLVTVAQALHWFDFDRFNEECFRVLRPGGVVAAWSYGLARVSSGIDEIINDFYAGEIDPFWPEGRHYVENQYRDIPFPFAKITPPNFEMTLRWSADQTLAYLRTWSAVQRFKNQHDRDPVDRIAETLRTEWGPGDRTVTWPLTLLIGRV